MKVLTAAGCGICLMVKNVLDTKHISYEIFSKNDLEGQRMLTECPIKNMPIIEHNGHYYTGTEALKYVKGL